MTPSLASRARTLAAAVLVLAALVACEEAAKPGGSNTPQPAAREQAEPARPEPPAGYSCANWVFDHPANGEGADGAVIEDRFYWGSRRGDAACTNFVTRSESVTGRQESVAGGEATEATTILVKEGGRVTAIWVVLHLANGRYCTGSLDGRRNGGAVCRLSVVPAGERFSIRELPALPPPAPTGDAPGEADDPPVNPPEPGGAPDGLTCPVGHVYNYDLNACCRDGSCLPGTAPGDDGQTGGADPPGTPSESNSGKTMQAYFTATFGPARAGVPHPYTLEWLWIEHSPGSISLPLEGPADWVDSSWLSPGDESWYGNNWVGTGDAAVECRWTITVSSIGQGTADGVKTPAGAPCDQVTPGMIIGDYTCTPGVGCGRSEGW